MKKILIIIEECTKIKQDRNELVNEYVNLKKSQGYQIDLIGDTKGLMRDLLEEKEASSKDITSAQADVMFDLNRYEYAIYVPETAKSNQDILAYKPDNLDKNMIFYNIGNMNIISSGALKRTRDENKESLRGFVTEAGDYTDNIDKAYTSQGTIGDEYDKSKEELVSEIKGVFNEPEEKIIENIEEAGQASKKSIHQPGEDSETNYKYSDDQAITPPSLATMVAARDENKETLKGYVTEEGDYTDNINKNYTPEGVVGDEYDRSKEDLVSDLEGVFGESKDQIIADMASAEQASIDSINLVSSDKRLTIGDISDKKKITL